MRSISLTMQDGWQSDEHVHRSPEASARDRSEEGTVEAILYSSIHDAFQSLEAGSMTSRGNYRCRKWVAVESSRNCTRRRQLPSNRSAKGAPIFLARPAISSDISASEYIRRMQAEAKTAMELVRENRPGLFPRSDAPIKWISLANSRLTRWLSRPACLSQVISKPPVNKATLYQDFSWHLLAWLRFFASAQNHSTNG